MHQASETVLGTTRPVAKPRWTVVFESPAGLSIDQNVGAFDEAEAESTARYFLELTLDKYPEFDGRMFTVKSITRHA
jgi:hypothetical protein